MIAVKLSLLEKEIEVIQQIINREKNLKELVVLIKTIEEIYSSLKTNYK